VQWDLVSVYGCFTQSLTVKLSVLALYNRIFSIHRDFKMWIYITTSIAVAHYVAFCIVQGLVCRPFAKFFDRTIKGSCLDDVKIVTSGEITNSIIDFGMIILAMVMIRSLQLSSKIKWKLRFLFGVGVLVGIFGFLKVGLTYQSHELYAFNMVSLLTCVQMFMSMLCCCLPVFHHILPASPSWSRFLSRRRASGTTAKASPRPLSDMGSPEFLESSERFASHNWSHNEENASMRNFGYPKPTHYAPPRPIDAYPLERMASHVPSREFS
jgi:hypothetical protein